MAEVKRVSDQYTISAPSILIDGNLTVTGSTTSMETINSVITDNTITLNQGEVGAGITAGTAGIEVDRGSLDNATFLFNESIDAWEIKIGSAYTNIRGADPINANDLVTKNYVDSGLVASSPGGPLASIQFNGGAVFSGVNELLWDGSNLLVQNLKIGLNGIEVFNVANGPLTLSAIGTGTINLESVVRLDNKATDKIAELGKNMFYAKNPGNAGSGLFFSNTTATDELVSRSKAILFGLIF